MIAIIILLLLFCSKGGNVDVIFITNQAIYLFIYYLYTHDHDTVMYSFYFRIFQEKLYGCVRKTRISIGFSAYLDFSNYL